MSRLRTRSEGLWSGSTPIDHGSVMFSFGPLEEVAPGLAFLEGFANVTALHTEDGVVLFDTGSPLSAPLVISQLQGWRTRPVHTAIYTHGHIDHVMGMAAIDEAAARARWSPATCLSGPRPTAATRRKCSAM